MPQPNLTPVEYEALRGMLAHQSHMQVHVYGDGVELRDYPIERKIAFAEKQHLAISSELQEALDEVKWKPWTKGAAFFNRDAYVGELIDAWHFLMNQFLIADVSAEELVEKYYRKAAKNKTRQNNGYDGKSTKCVGCGRALDDDAVDCGKLARMEEATFMYCAEKVGYFSA